MVDLPPPKCPMGYTRSQLVEILGEDVPAFDHWMRGQTIGICDGRLYNHEGQKYELSECAENPHGFVVYAHDLRRFLAGGEILD